MTLCKSLPCFEPHFSCQYNTVDIPVTQGCAEVITWKPCGNMQCSGQMAPMTAAICMRFSVFPRAFLFCRLKSHNDSDGQDRAPCPVSVHSGCCNNTPQTGWLTNNRNLFLTVLESESARPKCRHDQVLAKASSGLQPTDFLLCPHMVEGKRVLCGASFTTGLIPFIKAPFSGPSHLPQAPPPNVTTLGIRISICEFQRDTDIQNIAHTHITTEKSDFLRAMGIA